MFEGITCVYHSSIDLLFYVVGSSLENEVSGRVGRLYLSLLLCSAALLQLILANVLTTFVDTIGSVLR